MEMMNASDEQEERIESVDLTADFAASLGEKLIREVPELKQILVSFNVDS